MIVKNQIKKSFYQIKIRINKPADFLLHKYLYRFRDGNPYLYQPLETEKLPYPVNWKRYFDYEKLVVELGTGHGELIQFLSQRDKKNLHVGFEITKKYAKKSFNRISENKNALMFKGNGYEKIDKLFSPYSINQIYILFPDPWHKKRHNKRRPITVAWLRKVSELMDKNGEILFVTDWKDYYDYLLVQLEELNSSKAYFSVEKSAYRPDLLGLVSTHYYEKWLQQGREFYYIRMKRVD